MLKVKATLIARAKMIVNGKLEPYRVPVNSIGASVELTYEVRRYNKVGQYRPHVVNTSWHQKKGLEEMILVMKDLEAGVKSVGRMDHQELVLWPNNGDYFFEIVIEDAMGEEEFSFYPNDFEGCKEGAIGQDATEQIGSWVRGCMK
jgi:hypothetical protein